MLRLTLMLGAAIYAGLVIFSERLPADPSTVAGVARSSMAVDVLVPEQVTARDRLVTRDGRTLSIAVVIDPAATPDGTGAVAVVSTRGPETSDTLVASASNGRPERLIVEVTGNQVNLRAGPSTDTAVLGALVRGDQAELIAASSGGWVQIRAVSSGTVGYMADRFVSPMN